MLSQSGVFASSKSASQTRAPELSALIVIFLSVGPVISTRRSTRPGAGGATCHDASSLIWRVPGSQQLAAPLAELPVQLRQQAERLIGQDLVVLVTRRGGDLDAVGLGHACSSRKACWGGPARPAPPGPRHDATGPDANRRRP